MSIDSKNAILQNNFSPKSVGASGARPARQPSPRPQGEGLGVREAKKKRGPKLVLSPPKAPPRKKRGPKTPAGKARVSKNATSHGIWSFHPVVIEGFETKEKWESFLREMFESLAPEGAFEKELAERIAVALWRLRRVTHYETAVVNRQFIETADDLYISASYAAGGAEVPDPDEARVAAYSQTRVIPSANEVDKITRYETHLHRLFIQTLHELEARQARRRGEPTLLTRHDISFPPPNLGPFRTPHPANELVSAVNKRVDQFERSRAAKDA